ncbi:MAG: S-adenosylmethionine:tRNAribosyltransferase-isomerase [Nitrospirae bacterium]|nr:S-adenosylmethionine:tRNAribosyltransferase-isomerase [Nitrospirota bacterium]
MFWKNDFSLSHRYVVVLFAMTSPVSEHLRLSDFDFDLPEELIAQAPAEDRDRSRLLVLDRQTGAVVHRVFSDLGAYLVPGDLLVLNDTKVFPCRLQARKAGGGKAELFLLEEKAINLWQALVKGGVDAGKTVFVAPDIEAEVLSEAGDGIRLVRFHGVTDIRARLDDLGRTPLPPYIKREPVAEDRDRYQTVYASREGAVAAPTAGLHFTGELLQWMRDRGIGTAMVTLHVGPGTFQPVRTEDIARHRMHAERYDIPAGTAEQVNRARSEGRRIIAVGTTSVRALETAARTDGKVHGGAGSSELFITPGYRFNIVNGMVTNFHLPKSTLLMLVAAFAGRENVLTAYREAVRQRYRFFSYGDAMLIL